MRKNIEEKQEKIHVSWKNKYLQNFEPKSQKWIPKKPLESVESFIQFDSYQRVVGCFLSSKNVSCWLGLRIVANRK